jgi:hypothetical protein
VANRKRYIHDCPDCEYLGSYDRPLYEPHDLYYCPMADGGTILARYGDDGPEYTSFMLELMLNQGSGGNWESPLWEAARRKIKQWQKMEAK